MTFAFWGGVAISTRGSRLYCHGLKCPVEGAEPCKKKNPAANVGRTHEVSSKRSTTAGRLEGRVFFFLEHLRFC